jgi:hypothetical protein
VVLNVDGLLLAGGDTVRKRVAGLPVELIDRGNHRVGPAPGGAFDVRRRLHVVPAFAIDAHVVDDAARWTRERAGADADAARTTFAAVDDEVKGFELVARGFERHARGAAYDGGVGPNLLRRGRDPHRLGRRGDGKRDDCYQECSLHFRSS